ncbi:AtpZ/AtpI family protein [Saccharibacillus endophyticus]|uniref:AtpZ/AtpI family protein n=1 Tax=Saccharibacillus endophyticus TaxID=2060666 RepID=A0ABQ2A746_9BACL|nr:AtpZ/AtpI family protein [Saccharibacillus endophyticus]GGH86835.1 hypothetical protein GCM10007362_47540 [Saccharibacillus endophyticus]
MNKRDKPFNDKGPWKAIGLVSAIGIELAVFTLIGVFLGRWIDEKFGGSGLWVGIGVLAGLVLGMLGVVAVIRKVLEGSDE